MLPAMADVIRGKKPVLGGGSLVGYVMHASFALLALWLASQALAG